MREKEIIHHIMLQKKLNTKVNIKAKNGQSQLDEVAGVPSKSHLIGTVISVKIISIIIIIIIISIIIISIIILIIRIIMISIIRIILIRIIIIIILKIELTK